MRLGIFSDLHGNHATLERSLAAFQRDATDSIICLGDVLGKSGDNLRCLDLLFVAGVKIVRGNHDRLGMNSLPAPYQRQLKQHMSGLLRIDNLLLSHTRPVPMPSMGAAHGTTTGSRRRSARNLNSKAIRSGCSSTGTRTSRR